MTLRARDVTLCSAQSLIFYRRTATGVGIDVPTIGDLFHITFPYLLEMKNIPKSVIIVFGDVKHNLTSIPTPDQAKENIRATGHGGVGQATDFHLATMKSSSQWVRFELRCCREFFPIRFFFPGPNHFCWSVLRIFVAFRNLLTFLKALTHSRIHSFIHSFSQFIHLFIPIGSVCMVYMLTKRGYIDGKWQTMNMAYMDPMGKGKSH